MMGCVHEGLVSSSNTNPNSSGRRVSDTAPTVDYTHTLVLCFAAESWHSWILQSASLSGPVSNRRPRRQFSAWSFHHDHLNGVLNFKFWSVTHLYCKYNQWCFTMRQWMCTNQTLPDFRFHPHPNICFFMIQYRHFGWGQECVCVNP